MAEANDPQNLLRYQRQISYPPLGLAGQRKLAAASAVIVGVGGLGSWTAELLARAGVGRLRLVDDDRVALDNIHRQALYTDADAAARTPKVVAAEHRLAAINAGVKVEAVPCRLSSANIGALTDGVDLIVDGTDNFAARFIINDYAVKHGRTWVFAGVVGAEAQTMTIRPGRSACLRCVCEAPPPVCIDPSCRAAGVIGPAVAAIAAIEAAEAVKILSGNESACSTALVKFDLWTNQFQRIDAARPAAGCVCCGERHFEFLEGE